jgi:hypothetical protein
VKALKTAVKEANAKLSETGTPPIKLLVLDTFAKATAGAEENSARDMGPIMAALRSLADDLDICVLIIHHTGKNSALGLRGSTAILGDVDFNIEVIDHETGKKKRPAVSVPKGQLCMYVAKMRDAPKGTKLFFKLEPVIIGKDKWGTDETSMVVRPITQATIADKMGVVQDADDAPAACDKLSEELERDANIRAERTRKKTLEDIIEAMRTHGKGTAGRLCAKLQSLADVVPALQELKAQVGASNFVRRFKERLLLSDSEVDLYGGRLKLEDSQRRGSSARLVFTPAGS